MEEVNKKNQEKQPTHPIGEGNVSGGKRPQFSVKVNDGVIVFHDPVVTGREILNKAGFKPVECYTLYQKFKDCDFEKISLDEKVNLAKPGLEHFVVKDPEVFHYTIDTEPETSEKKHMTAAEILKAAGLDPKDYYLVEVFADQTQKSYKDNPDESIKLTCPGNKFISVFKGETPVS